MWVEWEARRRKGAITLGNAATLRVSVSQGPLSCLDWDAEWPGSSLSRRVPQAIIKAEPIDTLVSPVRAMAMDALSHLR